MTAESLDLRRAILESAGASPAECAELLAYNDNRFSLPDDAARPPLPLEDEPFVAAWAERLREAHSDGAWTALRRWMPQLHFPIAAGVSTSADYRRATRSGVYSSTADGGIQLQQPGVLAFELYASPAGRIPVVRTSCRADFETLVCALTRRNEPEPIPPSMGACMVSGHINWQSVRMELPHRDRFILISDGPYSGISASALAMDDAEWIELSHRIRIEHECVHYLTRRLFGAMTNSLLDELMADYSGIVAAIGAFRADWFLAFMGLSGRRHIGNSGRIRNYRGTPSLSAGAFAVLRGLVFDAAHNVEQFDAQLTNPRDVESRVGAITALAAFSLEELAAPDAPERLLERVPAARAFAHIT